MTTVKNTNHAAACNISVEKGDLVFVCGEGSDAMRVAEISRDQVFLADGNLYAEWFNREQCTPVWPNLRRALGREPMQPR